MPVPWQVVHICAAPFRLPRPAKKNKTVRALCNKDGAYSCLRSDCYIKQWEQRLGYIITTLICFVIGQRAFSWPASAEKPAWITEPAE